SGLRLERDGDQQGTIRVFVQFDDGLGLCRGDVGILKHLLVEELVKSVVKKVIVFDAENELLEDPVEWFSSFLENLIDEAGRGDALEGFKDKSWPGVAGATEFDVEIDSNQLFYLSSDGPEPLQMQQGPGPIQYQCSSSSSGPVTVLAFAKTCDGT